MPHAFGHFFLHNPDTIPWVGLDSKKRIFSEKMRKEAKRGEKRCKEAIMYGKSAYDIIEFNYCIGIQIWQYGKLNVL